MTICIEEEKIIFCLTFFVQSDFSGLGSFFNFQIIFFTTFPGRWAADNRAVSQSPCTHFDTALTELRFLADVNLDMKGMKS